MSNVAKQIIERVFCFSNTKGKFTRPITNIESGKPIYIKDIKVTAIEVNHSAYGAFAYLIECEGKKILHTRRYKTVIGIGPAIRKALAPAKDIDILITEGTTFSRPQVKAQTEAELAEEMIQITKNYNKVLLLCSTTNIDRIKVMIRVRE